MQLPLVRVNGRGVTERSRDESPRLSQGEVVIVGVDEEHCVRVNLHYALHEQKCLTSNYAIQFLSMMSGNFFLLPLS